MKTLQSCRESLDLYPGVSAGDQTEETAAIDKTVDMTVDMDGAHAGLFNELLLQVTEPVGEEETHPGGAGAQPQGDAEADLHLASMRVQPIKKAACQVCCCLPHHMYSLHYSGSKYLALPSNNVEGEHPLLAMELDRDSFSVYMGESEGGLEDLIMSVNINLGLI